MIKVIDISDYQGTPNFDQIKAAGYTGVITKASEGVNFRAKTLTRNQSECRRVGLLLGYYHFARPEYGNTPENEAQYFINQVWQGGPAREGEWFVLDMESANYADRVNWSKKFLDYLATKLNGTKGVFYTYLAMLQSANWKPIADADYGLWYAHYDNDADSINTVIPYWQTVAMKQYTSSGKVVSINGNVDLNTFFGDAATFKKYGFRTGNTPPPAEEMFLGKSKSYWLQVEKDREDLMKQNGDLKGQVDKIKGDTKTKILGYIDELKAKASSV